MAGGHMKHRMLGRKSSHRQALLRNLVNSLFEHESIVTTWPRAKEAQSVAEKLITLGKKNTAASKHKAQTVFYTPHEHMPKLFGALRERYADRPGGYTRVLRLEPTSHDAAPSAILELVDGPKDMRFALTARTVARLQDEGKPVNQITATNIVKVTRFRKNGELALKGMVNKIRGLEITDKKGPVVKKRKSADSRSTSSADSLAPPVGTL